MALFVDGIRKIARKLPDWARLVLAFWFFMMVPVMFGWISVPIQNEWMKALVLAPGILLVLALAANTIFHFVTSATWPFRKALSLWRKAH